MFGRWKAKFFSNKKESKKNKSKKEGQQDFFEDFDYNIGIRPCWPLAITTTDTGYQALISALTIGGSATCQMYSATSSDLEHWDIDSENPVLTGGFSYDRMGFLDASLVGASFFL